MAESEPQSREFPLGDAALDAMRGGFHILGGLVQMVGGIARLVALTALKAADAVLEAAEATEKEEKPKPKLEPKPR